MPPSGISHVLEGTNVLTYSKRNKLGHSSNDIDDLPLCQLFQPPNKNCGVSWTGLCTKRYRSSAVCGYEKKELAHKHATDGNESLCGAGCERRRSPPRCGGRIATVSCRHDSLGRSLCPLWHYSDSNLMVTHRPLLPEADIAVFHAGYKPESGRRARYYAQTAGRRSGDHKV